MRAPEPAGWALKPAKRALDALLSQLGGLGPPGRASWELRGRQRQRERQTDRAERSWYVVVPYVEYLDWIWPTGVGLPI